MSYQHYTLPQWEARIEGECVRVACDGEDVFFVAAHDAKALASIIVRAAASAGKETVKVIGKPRDLLNQVEMKAAKK
jgi:hypothetical protein